MEKELKGDISAIELPILRVGNNKSEANRTSRYILYWVLAIREVNRFTATELN